MLSLPTYAECDSWLEKQLPFATDPFDEAIAVAVVLLLSLCCVCCCCVWCCCSSDEETDIEGNNHGFVAADTGKPINDNGVPSPAPVERPKTPDTQSTGTSEIRIEFEEGRIAPPAVSVVRPSPIGLGVALNEQNDSRAHMEDQETGPTLPSSQGPIDEEPASPVSESMANHVPMLKVGLSGGEALPGFPGWERKWDPTRGSYFYVDHNTRQTHWEHPDGSDRLKAKLKAQSGGRGRRRKRRNSMSETGASVSLSASALSPIIEASTGTP